MLYWAWGKGHADVTRVILESAAEREQGKGDFIALNVLVTGDREALEEWMKTRYANAAENTEEMRGFRIEVKKRRIALDKETEREHQQSPQSRIPSVAAM